MQVLLTHLIKMESKERAEEANVNFKSQVFAANPDLYRQLFAEEDNSMKNDDIEWIIPESEEDFLRMLEED